MVALPTLMSKCGEMPSHKRDVQCTSRSPSIVWLQEIFANTDVITGHKHHTQQHLKVVPDHHASKACVHKSTKPIGGNVRAACRKTNGDAVLPTLSL